jgi:hypothetical protein
MNPVSRRLGFLLAALAAVFTLVWFRGRVEGGFRIDEAHKLSETSALRLLLEGRFDDPEWFATIVDRTNPPFGKYVFGAAALAGGETLPEVPSLARAAGPDDFIPPLFSPELSERYLPLLNEARNASLAITALTAALLVFLLARRSGIAAAIVGFALYVANFLTATFAATAVFDPLLTLLNFSAVVAALALWSGKRRSKLAAMAIGGGAGLFAGLAMATRVSGVIALLIALAAGVARPIVRREWRTVLLFALTAIIVAGAIPVLINPYYWSTPPEGLVSAEFSSDAALPVRIFERASLLHRDLEDLLSRTLRRTETLDGFGERSRFFMEIVAGDVQGLLLVLGASLAIVLVAAGAVDRGSAEASVVYAAVATTIVVAGWIPVAWPRYLLITVPLLSAAAAIGFVRPVALWWRRRRST